MKLHAFLPLAFCALASCATPGADDRLQDRFFNRLAALCGKAFAGRVVSSDALDRDMAGQKPVMHVRECSGDTIRIPFHVGENRSRTWVVSRTPAGLRLKHDHRHEDGTPDALTLYGGDTAGEGSESENGRRSRQEFPADEYSKSMFVRLGSEQSVPNVWAMEVAAQALFAYELRRPGRFFRVEFDLTSPVAPPPPPWGSR